MKITFLGLLWASMFEKQRKVMRSNENIFFMIKIVKFITMHSKCLLIPGGYFLNVQRALVVFLQGPFFGSFYV